MIEGKIVNLRAREMSDLDRFYAWINDREVTRFLNMRYPISYAAEEEFVGSVVARPAAYNWVGFSIEAKDGTHIGTINFHESSAEDRRAILGVMIGDKAHWSRGYGTDEYLCLFGLASRR